MTLKIVLFLVSIISFTTIFTTRLNVFFRYNLNIVALFTIVLNFMLSLSVTFLTIFDIFMSLTNFVKLANSTTRRFTNSVVKLITNLLRANTLIYFRLLKLYYCFSVIIIMNSLLLTSKLIVPIVLQLNY